MIVTAIAIQVCAKRIRRVAWKDPQGPTGSQRHLGLTSKEKASAQSRRGREKIGLFFSRRRARKLWIHCSLGATTDAKASDTYFNCSCPTQLARPAVKAVDDRIGVSTPHYYRPTPTPTNHVLTDFGAQQGPAPRGARRHTT